jgi:RNA polymerase sigma-70 factor (ECF subfamily)
MAIDDDRRLAARIIAGDTGAVEEFVSQYQPFIYAILVRSLNLRPDEADEIFQRFLFHIWEDEFRRLRDWKGKTKLSAYLAQIVRNLAHDYRRDYRRQPPLERPDKPDIPAEERVIANIERRQMIDRALSRLSDRDRYLIHQRFILEQSPSEIAATLGVTTNSVGVALSRARRRLKKILSRM